MKRALFFIIIIISFILVACSSNEAPSDEPIYNLVDERYELVSLVFRLAGNPEYSEISTDYQRRLHSVFDEFITHPIVDYAKRNLRFGYDAVFGMAIHLEKTGESFSIVNNISFLTEERFLRWTETKIIEFVELLNNFYIESNFAEFFNNNIEYYNEHSKRFAGDIINQINFDWFRQYGINPENMRIVLSPSGSDNGYAGWVYDENPENSIVYAALPVVDNFQGFLWFVIHEFAHSIGNPLADIWYYEHDDFRMWADSSVDIKLNPSYPYGITMAYEYITRAYMILYLTENTEMSLTHLLLFEYSNGFPYIQSVYAMITEHEIIDDLGSINVILGVDDYIIGEEQSVDFEGQTIIWYTVDLLGHELLLEALRLNGIRDDILGSQTGDVLYVITKGKEYLYIDLGSAQDIGWSAQHRMYCVFLLD